MDEESDDVELEELDEVPEEVPEVPDHTMTDEEVEWTEFRYSTRGPNDYIVSRPSDLFRDAAHAEQWARLRFGDRYRGRMQTADEYERYCFIVRKP